MADSLENLTPEQRQELSLGRLAKQLLTTPETREDTARLLHKADKSLVFPDIQAKDELRKVQEKADERINDLAKKLHERDAREALAKQHARIEAAGLDIKMVNELMEKHGIPPTEDGYGVIIELIQARAQLAEPTTEQIQPFRIPNIKEMWTDPVKWREEEGYKVLNELIAARKRA